MDNRELAALIDRKLASALNDEGDTLSATRQDNLDRYMGEKLGNEREGHSQVTTREVFEAIEWAMPSVMRVFGSQKTVAFIPEGAEDEQAADQETDVLRHLLFDQGNGFLAIHNWCKDTLMNPNGYAKVWVEEVERTTTERYKGLSIEQVVGLSEGEGVELIAATAYQTPFGEVYDAEAKITQTKPVLKFCAVPADEVLVDGDLATIDLDEAGFVCHRRERTLTDLVKEGYSRKRLEAIGGDDTESDEETNRRKWGESDTTDDDGALRKYKVEECYLLVDFDGDGLAERRRVVKIANEIFENEEWDYRPLIAMAAILIPHMHAGVSLAEAVKDLQEVSTALMRQLLTNIYRINVPKKYVGSRALVDGGATMDALLDGAAEIVPVEDPSAIVPEMIAPVFQHILPVMQQLTEQKMLRTGVNPNISLDPKVLAESTMGAFTAAIDHASQRLELIIRVMAETGIKTLLKKAHRLVREHFGSELAIKLRGEWAHVSPREWRERTNIKATVGIGTQNKQERLQALMSLLQLQEKLMALRMVEPQHIYNTVAEMIEAAGLEGAERYVINPAKQPIQQGQPDPLVMAQVESLKAQGQAMQIDAQSKMARAQIEAQKAQLERERAQFEVQIKARQAEVDAQLAAGKAQAEVRHINADALLKEAQRVKVLEEARGLDIDNDASETGVAEVLRRVANGEGG